MGLEKAGKSTFINALIGLDILPTDGARCTYTITNIALRHGPFKIRISPKLCTFTQFKSREEQLKKSAGAEGPDGINANIDLDQIEKNRTAIEALVSTASAANGNSESRILKDVVDRDIMSTDQARSAMRQVIANPAVAFALEEVRVDIWSPNFISKDESVFDLVDLPGLDSGLRIHEDLAKTAMADADGIIFAQNIEDADLPARL